MERLINLPFQPDLIGFNPKPSTVMHIDLNSCFARVEQQANPLLRGKPIAVAAYPTPGGCILAPSVEAKKFGVKTGMRVKEGRLLCPQLIVLSPDPDKYRFIHRKLKSLLSFYVNNPVPKSIDEFVLDFEGEPAFALGMHSLAKEVKKRIKAEIGDWLTVSIGIAPNRFLAKQAASLHKPDGLGEINKDNFAQIYSKLSLTDLFWIKERNMARLNRVGIYTVPDFYRAPLYKLRAAFESINGYYWYLRLLGWEIDDVEFGQRSFGNSFALPKPLTSVEQLSPILQRLVEKTGMRLRQAGMTARGVHVAVVYRDFNFWHHGHSLQNPVFDSRDIYKEALKVLASCPYRKPVRELSVSCFKLAPIQPFQEDLFGLLSKKQKLAKAIDKINQRWGSFVITPARMLNSKNLVLDRIAFGGVKELEEIVV